MWRRFYLSWIFFREFRVIVFGDASDHKAMRDVGAV
jgi:hypothetical protein